MSTQLNEFHSLLEKVYHNMGATKDQNSNSNYSPISQALTTEEYIKYHLAMVLRLICSQTRAVLATMLLMVNENAFLSSNHLIADIVQSYTYQQAYVKSVLSTVIEEKAQRHVLYMLQRAKALPEKIAQLLWWLKLKKFLRERIEDLRLGTKICENLCRFYLLRKDLISKFDQVPTLNYYCYLYYFGSGKLYDWGQLRPYIISFRLILNYSSSQYSFTTSTKLDFLMPVQKDKNYKAIHLADKTKLESKFDETVIDLLDYDMLSDIESNEKKNRTRYTSRNRHPLRLANKGPDVIGNSVYLIILRNTELSKEKNARVAACIHTH
ncbi:hypothetical protein PHYBLDRAFT_63508 [Phycomyces blakesleeanus NRRL 1555(-)]|uniref:Uncharacterized protein n=1 Tax=Phycomyces blakesleeanus (strain ATCC 8743b / DSM 1359 / FGSC 10004 / NBRC 33097 / NRRL 1555) TaxID=763407 RepID=A0A162TNN8_PHYB8|nr:hypothetical protein PHYBLDRAFT_63508 [Phycomyces blakesleeanus NRRL 1555(-)]OAD68583.1 hypothetical protein PHYBLDRAFT_63508 [Phycomyces blakesleeanus NRRL 1555(-)]|eukprot:XP_018286623.1 hypothetical protein PHYBLDRAFT_63508 [Phycomyces blakesleeanus NRRL 1555(-)]